MTKEITKHTLKLIIQFYDGSKAYIDEKHRSQFMKAINDKRFIEIEGTIWNTREIRLIYSKRPRKMQPVWTPPEQS